MKKIYISSDHAGYELKENLYNHYKDKDVTFELLGAKSSEDKTSYSLAGHELANKVLEDETIGVAVCGSGIGISIALNRHKKIVAARVTSVEDAHLARQHNNANVIALGGRQLSLSNAIDIVDEFLNTEFEGGRHIERILQLDSEK